MKYALIALFFTTSLMAIQAQQAYLYKDSRVMGMGGTDIAIGAHSTSLFSNPASLARIKKRDGFVVDLLGLGIAATQNVQNFVDDVESASDDAQALEDVLQKYKGDNFHVGIDNYSSISQHSDMFAWSIGFLAASDTNLMAHSNGTSNGDFIETASRVYAGAMLGVAKPFYTGVGRIDIGLGVKYITQKSFEGTVGVFDYVNENDFIDRYEKKASGMGGDFGITYHILNNKSWHLAVASSVMNIGLDLDDNYGHQPMTVNVGFAATTKISFLNRLVFAVDYIDVLGANKYREYTTTDNGSSTEYIDYDAHDFMKNLRVGTRVTFVDNDSLFVDVAVGMYQSALSTGLDVEISAFKLSLSTYQEEVGISSETSNTDRRYMVQLGIGW